MRAARRAKCGHALLRLFIFIRQLVYSCIFAEITTPRPRVILPLSALASVAARTGKKKRKSKGGLIHGQPAKQPQQPQASAHGSQHQKSAQKQQSQPHKGERVSKDAKAAQRHLAAAAPVPPPQHKKPSAAASQLSSKKQKMWEEEDDDEDEEEQDEEQDQYDGGDDDDDDDDLVDEYGDEPEAGDDDQDDDGDDDDDDETERFVDADKHGGSGKKSQSGGQKSGTRGSSSSSAGFAVGDRRANEFVFELEVLAARKAADVPAARPTGDDDDARGASMLEWLLAPLPVEQFFAEFWERKPLLIKRHAVAPSYHKDLFSRADLNRLLSSGGSGSGSGSAESGNADDEADAGLQYTVDLDVTSYKDGKRKTHNLDGRATLEQINSVRFAGFRIHFSSHVPVGL